GYRATALGFYQRNNVNPLYQEQRQSMEDTLSKFMSKSKKRHKENSNLIKEIRASTDADVRNQGASIKTLEIQIGQMSKVLQERGFGSLPSSTETNPRDHVKSISSIVKADTSSIRQMQEVVLFYNGLDVPTRQILDSRGAIPSKTAADAEVANQQMAKYSRKWHNGRSRTRST
nr:hypothetical protein [Tanacetum cinerariifolium]